MPCHASRYNTLCTLPHRTPYDGAGATTPVSEPFPSSFEGCSAPSTIACSIAAVPADCLVLRACCCTLQTPTSLRKRSPRINVPSSFMAYWSCSPPSRRCPLFVLSLGLALCARIRRPVSSASDPHRKPPAYSSHHGVTNGMALSPACHSAPCRLRSRCSLGELHQLHLAPLCTALLGSVLGNPSSFYHSCHSS